MYNTFMYNNHLSAQFIIYASCHVSNMAAEAAILPSPPYSLHSAY